MSHPYCTLPEIEAELPQCVDRWGDANIPSEATVLAKVAENDELVDAYLASRYSVPLDPVPSMVMRISRDLTIADLREIMYADSPDLDDSPGPARRKRAMDLLRGLADGSISLDPAGVTEADTAAGDVGRPLGSWADDAEPTFKLEDRW